MKRALDARLAVLFVVFIGGMFAINYSNDPIGFAQQTLPTLVLSDFQFESPLDGTPDYYLEQGEQANLKITGTLRNESNVSASNFNIVFSLRSEDSTKSLDVFPSGFICSSVGSGGCSNVTIGANQTLEVSGQLIVDSESPAGRYFVDISIDDFGVTLSTTSITDVDLLLVVGTDRPEYHPIALSFSPPSPIPPDSVLTIRTTLENTGRPAADDEILIVQFEYCPLANNVECTDSDFRTTGFEGTGARTLSGTALQNLRIGRDLVITNQLNTNTANLSAGSYIVRVSVTATVETVEEDNENNEISTFFRVGGNVGTGICTIEGDVTTLGEATGQVEGATASAQILFAASVQEDGDAVLHTLDFQAIKESTEVLDECPFIVEPIILRAPVSAFAFDNRANILYIGLTNGDLVVNDFSLFSLNATGNPTLAQQTVSAAGSELLSLWAREVSANSSQLFVGSRSNQLTRLDINRISGTQSFQISQTVCETEGTPVRNVQIFRGNVYYTAGDSLFRFSQSVCGNRALTVFDGNSTITALDLTQVDVSSGIGARLSVGLQNGEVHVLDIFGSHVTPTITFNSAIMAIASNTDVAAQDANRESIFVGTMNGVIDRIFLENGGRCAAPYQTPNQTAISVLDSYSPDEASAFTDGLAFAASADNLVIVLDDNCNMAVPPETELGEISSNVLSQKVTALDPVTFEESISSVIFTYAVGSDLVRKEVP